MRKTAREKNKKKTRPSSHVLFVIIFSRAVFRVAPQLTERLVETTHYKVNSTRPKSFLAFSTILGHFALGVRTVPTSYKGFFTRLGSYGKRRSLQGLLKSANKNCGSHAFFKIISLESQPKC